MCSINSNYLSCTLLFVKCPYHAVKFQLCFEDPKALAIMSTIVKAYQKKAYKDEDRVL